MSATDDEYQAAMKTESDQILAGTDEVHRYHSPVYRYWDKLRRRVERVVKDHHASDTRKSVAARVREE